MIPLSCCWISRGVYLCFSRAEVILKLYCSCCIDFWDIEGNLQCTVCPHAETEKILDFEFGHFTRKFRCFWRYGEGHIWHFKCQIGDFWSSLFPYLLCFSHNSQFPSQKFQKRVSGFNSQVVSHTLSYMHINSMRDNAFRCWKSLDTIWELAKE